MKLCLTVLSLMLALLSGCAGNTDNAYNDEDRNGTQLFNAEDARRDANQETRDWQMSDQNPNFINMSGGRHDRSLDVDKARQTVSQIEGYEPGQVWITGNVLQVTVFKEGHFHERDRARSQRELERLLTKALPRYHIEVTVQEDQI
ncbi:hypothetical protein [Mesobacillus harenae]|uniref:hypothetical protein n=1 Tax=Mesobacillus harenae TaxID=2213203 RepID=UPI00158009F7|nr:hypothetical protein [Mesobacillus harenae]